MHAYIQSVQSASEENGFTWELQDIDGAKVFVAKKSEFKPLLGLVKLYYTVTVQVVDHVTVQSALEFSSVTMERVKKEHEGLPTGLQSGIVSLAVLVSDRVDDDVREALSQRPQVHFAAFELPIVHDAQQNHLIYYTKTPIFGGLMYPSIRKKIRTLLGT